MANSGEMSGGNGPSARFAEWWNRLIALWHNPFKNVVVTPPLEAQPTKSGMVLRLNHRFIEPTMPGRLTTTLARGGNALCQLYEPLENGGIGTDPIGAPIKVIDTKCIPSGMSPLPVGCVVQVGLTYLNRRMVTGYDCDLEVPV